MRALLAALALAAPAAAQHVSISADVSKTEVALDEQLVLSVAVTGAQASLPDPQLPRLDNFSVYSSGRSQNIQFVNGQVSSSVTYQYVLVPRFVGKGTIPPISITVGGQTAQTSPIEISVVKPGSPTPSAAQGRPAPGRGAAQPGGARRPRAFVTAELDKKKAYVNEQVTLTVKFHTAVNLLSNPQYVAPKTDGFLPEDLPPERHNNAVISGQQYYVSEIKTALFPAHPGRLTVGSALVRCQIGEDVSVDPFAPDFFDRFFSGGLTMARNVDLRSDPASVEALPLPAAGKPADFSGAVGRFTIAAAVDRPRAKVGEAISLTVTVAGTGNLKAVGDPSIPETPSLRRFETVSSLNLDKRNDVVNGSKVFKTVLVPRVSGDVAVPAIRFSYFDPKEGAYKSASTGPIPLKIQAAPGGESQQAPAAASGSTPNLTSISEDIRYLKQPRGEPALDRLLAALAGAGPLNSIPFAVLLVAGLAEGLRLRRESDPAGQRFRAAKRAALRRVEAARAAEPQHSAALMAEALAGYLADKLGQPAAGLTLRRAQELLRGSCQPPTLDMLKSVWEDLDLQRFAPPSAANGGGKTAADALEQLLEALEGEIKK